MNLSSKFTRSATPPSSPSSPDFSLPKTFGSAVGRPISFFKSGMNPGASEGDPEANGTPQQIFPGGMA